MLAIDTKPRETPVQLKYTCILFTVQSNSIGSSIKQNSSNNNNNDNSNSNNDIEVLDSCTRKVFVKPCAAWETLEKFLKMRHKNVVLEHIKYTDADGDEIYVCSQEELENAIILENILRFHLYITRSDICVEYTAQNLYADIEDQRVGKRYVYVSPGNIGAVWRSIEGEIHSCYPKARIDSVGYKNESGNEIRVRNFEELDAAIFKRSIRTLKIMFVRHEIKVTVFNPPSMARNIYPLSDDYWNQFTKFVREKYPYAKISEMTYTEKSGDIVHAINNEDVDRAIRKGIYYFNLLISVEITYTLSRHSTNDQPDPMYGVTTFNAIITPNPSRNYDEGWVKEQLVNDISRRGISNVQAVKYNGHAIVVSREMMEELVLLKGVNSFHIKYK